MATAIPGTSKVCMERATHASRSGGGAVCANASAEQKRTNTIARRDATAFMILSLAELAVIPARGASFHAARRAVGKAQGLIRRRHLVLELHTCGGTASNLDL